MLACPVGPTINLDSKHYKLVDQMESLTEAAPSLIEAKSLTVKGPVKFVAETVIKGDVLVNNGEISSRMDCPVQKFATGSIFASLGCLGWCREQGPCGAASRHIQKFSCGIATEGGRHSCWSGKDSNHCSCVEVLDLVEWSGCCA